MTDRSAYYQKNKEYILAYQAERRKDPRVREMQRGYNDKRQLAKYNITRGEYDATVAAQGARCALCGGDDPKSRGRWHVDHDHVTGKVRGLLCGSCNRGIGYLRDDPELLAMAAQWVFSHRPMVAA